MSALVVGVDARELLGRPTGVGRYLAELLARWAGDGGGERFVLYAPAAPDLPASASGSARVELRVIPGGASTWWEQVALPRAIAADPPAVLFCPAYTAPLRARIPVALTIHDLAFFHRPRWFRAREGMRRRWITRRSAARARIVLTDSEHSRSDLHRWLRVPDERVRVIPLGVTGPRVPASAEARREPLVLFVGSLFNRRRIPDLIGAFARVAHRHPDARLEIVGDNRTRPRQDPEAIARRAGLGGDRVAVRSYLPRASLDGLLARARAFAFLSEYEGFGLTPLEALAAGVPILVADTPVAREVYGSAAIYVPLGDVEAAARGLETLLYDPNERQRLLDAAPGLLRRYSWEHTAHETLEAIREAAGRRP